nr:MAG TPA: hypothetical protein [Caudoviricetes sp.]
MVAGALGILIGSPIVSTIGLPMLGHLFVWSSSRVDNLTVEERWCIINT